MFEAVPRRLVLAVDTVDIVDIVDMVDTVPFAPEAAAPRVAGRSAVAVHPRLGLHRKEEAQSAGPPVPKVQQSSLQTLRVPPYRKRCLQRIIRQL